ncbi:hypothetical protein DFH06DRAFT_161632 [Mycena polygramma]|nr:hypothetical protein DFH06DRAFT_161632 [Mycena polygramma]
METVLLFDAHDVASNKLLWRCELQGRGWDWLCQASYIFNCCHITSNWQDHELMEHIDFVIAISTTTALPAGFLFVCPPEAFVTGPSSFCYPECPAYWSFDPSGVERLTTEQAIELGFPTLEFSTEIEGKYWDDSVYARLRKFHQAKGFDSYSQDLARHLGHRLYQPSANVYASFAHIDDADVSSEDDDQDSAMDVDREGTEEDCDEILFPMDLD